jgi:cbb3-type cytochrome oxidase maturation protein
MDILFLLVPLSVILVFAIVGVFWWSLQNGQFDNLESPASDILDDLDAASPPKPGPFDMDQRRNPAPAAD